MCVYAASDLGSKTMPPIWTLSFDQLAGHLWSVSPRRAVIVDKDSSERSPTAAANFLLLRRKTMDVERRPLLSRIRKCQELVEPHGGDTR